jgi:hypothetical protein
VAEQQPTGRNSSKWFVFTGITDVSHSSLFRMPARLRSFECLSFSSCCPVRLTGLLVATTFMARMLRLHNNQLSGSIPSSISSLVLLRYLSGQTGQLVVSESFLASTTLCRSVSYLLLLHLELCLCASTSSAGPSPTPCHR